MEDPGWRLGFTPAHHLVNNTDAYGDQVIETIFRGFSLVSLDFRSLEWKTGVLNASNPFSAYTATGVTTFKPGVVGRRGTDISGAVVLTALTGTPAATAASPATATFTHAIIREGFNAEWTFGAQNRVLPVGFRILPTDSTGAQYFSAT